MWFLLSKTHSFFCHEDEGVENLAPVCSAVPLIHSDRGEFEQPIWIKGS